MSGPTITHCEPGARGWVGREHQRYPSESAPDNVPGELLTMSDGSEWFHPYDGSRPTQTKPPTAGEL
jgi:hypothetical protein